MAGLTINKDEVHVWELRLSESAAGPEELYDSFLSEDEIDRADKLRFKEDRLRFKIARGNLRLLLSRYADKKPRQLWIMYGRYGKPYLNEESNPGKISFNLTHSKDMVLYAFSADRKLGIDVEYERPVSKADKIIERFFSEKEKAYYRSQDSESKSQKFFKLWCSREAYSKALGSGINLPRDTVDISFATGEPINGRQKSNGIRIYPLESDQQYTAYLAVSGNEPKIIQREIKSAL